MRNIITKLFLLSVWVLAGLSLDAQCINTSAFGTIAIPTGCPGAPVTATTCAFGGEFSTFNTIVAGRSYTFNATGGAGNFLTVTTATNMVVGFGPAPVTVVAPAGATSLRVHVNTTASPACGTDFSCHTVTGTCVDCMLSGGPANDMCMGGIPVTLNMTSGVSTATGTTVNSCTDAVATCGTTLNTAGGVWYSFVAPATGMVTVNTCTGTTFDSKIGVFTGACTALTCVAGNDDACGLQSQVVFNGTAGTTYSILVTGFGATTGAFTLTVSMDPCLFAAPVTATISPAGPVDVCPNESVDLEVTATGGLQLVPAATGWYGIETAWIAGDNALNYYGPNGTTNPVVVSNAAAITAISPSVVVGGSFYGIRGATDELVRVQLDNPAGPSVTTIGPLTGVPYGANNLAWSLTHNPVTGKTYLLVSNGFNGYAAVNAQSICEVNLATGACSNPVVVNIPVSSVFLWMAFDGSGTAYAVHDATQGVTTNNPLYSINLATGAATLVGNSGVDLDFIQTAAAGPTGAILAAGYNGSGANGIYTVNTTTGAFTQIKDLGAAGFPGEITGFGYYQSPLAAPGYVYSWTPVDGNLSCTNCANPTFTAPKGQNGTYTYTLTVSDLCGSVSSTVTFNANYVVEALACNDLVNISVDDVCGGAITADMILGGALQCDPSAYCVIVKDGNTVIANPPAGGWNAYVNTGKRLTVEIQDPLLQVSCWGYAIIEDNIEPTVTGCGTTTNIQCNQVAEYLSSATLGRPSAANIVDNCDAAYTWNLVDVTSSKFGNNDCQTRISKTWTTSFLKKDGSTGTLSCTRFFESLPFDPTTLRAPQALVLLNCGAATDPASLPAAAAYPRVGNVNIVPGTTSICGLISTYSDVNLDACAVGCSGNSKVIRTWTVFDWCANTAYGPFVQVIKATDSEGPTFIVKDTVVSTRPWDCTSDFFLPLPWEMHDNCDAAPKYRVTGPIAVLAPGAPGNPSTTRWYAKGAPKGVHSFKYIGFDCCNNETVRTAIVTVIDKVAPVVTTKQDIVVGLTGGGAGSNASAKLFTYHFDNGSFDACTNVRVEIRRADDAPACDNIGNGGHNNNRTFNNDGHSKDDSKDTDGGQFVKFCCQDITAAVVDVNGDGVKDAGYVEVIVRVWDDADMNGVYGTAGDNYNEAWAFVKVEDNTPPVVVGPADVTIYCDWGIDNNFATNDANITRRSQVGNIQGWKAMTGVDFSKTGVASAYSTCQNETVEFVDVTLEDEGDFAGNCGEALYTRVWRVTKQLKTGPAVQYAFQKITSLTRGVLPLDPTVNDNNKNGQIDNGDFGPFPVSCAGPTAADLAGKFSAIGGPCQVIGENIKVDTFLFEGGVCKKYVASYTYTDWCTNQTRFAGQITFMYFDTEKPVLADCTPKMFPVDANCSHVISVSNSATDNGGCIDGGWLKWQVFLDTWGDGTINHYGSSFVDAGTYANWTAVPGNSSVLPSGNNYAATVWVKYVAPTADAGTVTVKFDKEPLVGSMSNHKITWKVTDGCHNHSSCGYDIMVVDKKAPTPYCVSLSTALMQNGGVELWARDFDKGSFDNCTDQDDLYLTFNEMHPVLSRINQDHFFTGQGVQSNEAAYLKGDAQKWVASLKSSAKIFDCDEYNAQGPNGAAVKMSVWDAKLNTDFCVVYLTIVDNQGACGAGGSRIAGTISTESSVSVSDVTVTVESNINDINRVATVDGAYSFENLPNGLDYTVNANKVDAYDNGVSTLDLVLIQRHILGKQNLESAYKMIAADVTNDGQIRANDLVELRKLVLGVTDKFTAPSWTIVNANEPVAMATPLSFNTEILINNLQAHAEGQNFMAVKGGDVNGNAVANARANNVESRTNNTVVMIADNMNVVAGQTISVPVSSSNFANVYGYQFTTNLNGLTLAGVRSGAINMTDANVGVINNNTLTTSWSSADAVSTSEVLFTLDFVATKSGKLNQMININSNITKAESYVGTELEVGNVELTFRNENAVANNSTLFQNEPNPFTTTTSVAFELANAGKTTFTLYDVTGKVVLTKNVEGAKGLNTVTFNANEMRVSGIVYYQIESGDFTATKKMMIIE